RFPSTPETLLAHSIAPPYRLQLPDVLCRELRPVDLERQLVELAGEPERYLVVLVIHGRAGVGAYVEVRASHMPSASPTRASGSSRSCSPRSSIARNRPRGRSGTRSSRLCERICNGRLRPILAVGR